MTATHWTSRTVFSFDLETTNADPLLAHVVSGTVQKLEAGTPTAKRSWLVKPAVEISEEAISIHGITNEFVAEHGQDPKAALEDLAATLAKVLKAGLPLVVFNAAYDLTVVELQCELYGIPTLRDRLGTAHWPTVIDPFILARGYDTYKTSEGSWGKGYKLPEVCARYGVPFEETHDATADAEGAGRLAIALVRAHSDLASASPQELHAMQVDWRTRLQDGLRAYFDRKKIEHDGVDAGWPLHSSLVA